MGKIIAGCYDVGMRVLSLLFLSVLVGGCVERPLHAPSQPATQAAVAAAAPPPVEVRYDAALKPEALSAAEKADLTAASLKNASVTSRAWFICVKYNRHGIFAADVYFVPDRASARIRRGTFARTESWGDLLSLVEKGPSREMSRYVQVSAPEVPFDDRLTVPSDQMMPFDPERSYFGEPVKLTDDEFVELVDLVRPVFAKEGGGPICRIERKGEKIRVFSGPSQGPLSGRGRFVDLKRKAGGGFELAGNEVGIWAS